VLGLRDKAVDVVSVERVVAVIVLALVTMVLFPAFNVKGLVPPVESVPAPAKPMEVGVMVIVSIEVTPVRDPRVVTLRPVEVREKLSLAEPILIVSAVVSLVAILIVLPAVPVPRLTVLELLPVPRFTIPVVPESTVTLPVVPERRERLDAAPAERVPAPAKPMEVGVMVIVSMLVTPVNAPPVVTLRPVLKRANDSVLLPIVTVPLLVPVAILVLNDPEVLILVTPKILFVPVRFMVSREEPILIVSAVVSSVAILIVLAAVPLPIETNFALLPLPRSTSPVVPESTVTAPVPLELRVIPVFVVDAEITGFTPEKVNAVDVKVLVLIVPPIVKLPLP